MFKLVKKQPQIESTIPKELSQFVGTLTEAELAEMFQTQLTKLTGKVAEAELQGFAITAVVNEVRKINKKANFVKKAEASRVFGFIVGDGGLWDKIGNMISAAQNYVKKNNMGMAVQDNYVNGDGQILDRREKLFGKPNPNYLKPLPDKISDANRTLYLVARIGESKQFKFGTIQSNDAPLCRGWNKIRFFTPCSTWGIVKENEGMFKLNASTAEDTTSVFRALNEDLDVTQTFLDVVTPNLTEITNVERIYELTKDAWDRITFVKGKVAWIGRDRPTPFGAIKMGIMDENGVEVVVSIPEQIGKDFGELSEVIVIGKPERGDLKVVDEDTGKFTYQKKKGDVYIQAVGIFVTKATPIDVFSGEALGDAQEIEGWVS